MGLHGERDRDLPTPEDLDQTTLGDQTTVSECVRVDRRARVEPSQLLEVDDGVLDTKRVLEALRLRCAPGDRGLAPLEAGLDRAARALALRAPARRLATFPRDAAPDATRGSLRSRRWFQIVHF